MSEDSVSSGSALVSFFSRVESIPTVYDTLAGGFPYFAHCQIMDALVIVWRANGLEMNSKTWLMDGCTLSRFW